MDERNPPWRQDPAALPRAELEEHARSLHTVLAVAESVHRATDVTDLVERTVQALVTHTRFPAVFFYRLDDARQQLRLAGSRGVPGAVLDAVAVLPVEGSLNGMALRQGDVVTSQDVGSDARADHRAAGALRDAGYVESVSTPVLDGSRRHGTISLVFRDASGLSGQERRALLAMGRTVGLALSFRLADEERRRLSTSLQRAEQMAQLGVVAGGMAHGFNNILTGIQGHLAMARDMLAADGAAKVPETLAELSHAQQAADRAREMVREFVAFSPGGGPVRERLDDTAALLGRIVDDESARAGATCRFTVTGGPAAVIADRAQLGQAFRQVLRNAIEAGPRGAAVEVDLDVTRASATDAGRPTDALRVTVTDHGEGISAENLPRVVEPFFTTRPGRGGMGLTAADFIVRRHGGTLELASTPGEGTRVTLSLPLASSRAPTPPTGTPAAGTRVLVMDDDEGVRAVTLSMLRHRGYDAEAVEEGGAALALYRQRREEGRPFAVVLLDLTVVHGEGGLDAVAALHAMDPTVRAVVTSGYSHDPVMANHREHGFCAVLEKPFTPAQLVAAVEKARAADPPDAPSSP